MANGPGHTLDAGRYRLLAPEPGGTGWRAQDTRLDLAADLRDATPERLQRALRALEGAAPDGDQPAA